MIDKKDLKQKLSPISFHVTQENGTEPPFENPYWDHFEEGIYVDIVSGEPLFSSTDKFESDCGWPSFSKSIEKLKSKADFSFGIHRIEIRSNQADSHLGHLFTDGPKELGGLRYCINSASMRFVSRDNLEKEGYGAYLVYFKQNL